MPAGGHLTLALSCIDGQLQLEVRDTGRGIPDNIRSRVFDPYFTTKASGSGMGLAVCEKIIRQHNGQIGFDTGPQGTAFRVSLPAGDADGR
jgi:two-component system nitrogen regulation sensor histidine kinase GlnL